MKQIHLHPQYVPDPVPLWDISLIELADKVVYTDHVQPVCFSLTDDAAVEPNNAWVTGWGTTSGLFSLLEEEEGEFRGWQHLEEPQASAGSLRQLRHLLQGVRKRLRPHRPRFVLLLLFQCRV